MTTKEAVSDLIMGELIIIDENNETSYADGEDLLDIDFLVSLANDMFNNNQIKFNLEIVDTYDEQYVQAFKEFLVGGKLFKVIVYADSQVEINTPDDVIEFMYEAHSRYEILEACTLTVNQLLEA